MIVVNLAIPGAGNIGAALAGGLLKSNAADANSLVATTQSEDSAKRLREMHGITSTAGKNREAAAAADVIIIGVKPHTVPKILDEIRDVLHDDQILESLAAVLTIDVIEKRVRIFRWSLAKVRLRWLRTAWQPQSSALLLSDCFAPSESSAGWTTR